MNAQQFVSALGPKAKPKQTTSGWSACCPAHEDRSASLSIGTGNDGRVLVHCHAGCELDAIVSAVGLKRSDLFNDKANGHGKLKLNGKTLNTATTDQPKRQVAVYDYTNEAGQLLFQVVRYEPKTFRQRRPDGKGGFVWTLDDTRRVLYRLPEVLRAVQHGSPVLVVEGEKDADALAKVGLCATCGAGGAGKWRDEYNASLTGATCYIIADKDAPGRKLAQQVAASLHGKAAAVHVLELPDRNGAMVKDPADWLAAGATVADLFPILDAAPEWKPSATKEAAFESWSDVLAAFNKKAGGASDMRGAIVSALTDQNLKAREQRQIISALVVEALAERGRFYYHAELRDFATAMYFDSERRRLERVQGDAFLAWLAEWTGINRADALFAAVIAEVETVALSDTRSAGILPEVFFTQRDGRVYLSNGDADVCRISAGKVEVLPNGTDGVLFAAGRTLKPWKLTEPQDFFETCSLFSNIQDAAANARELVRLWTLSLPTAPRSKPPLCLFGEIGSGKTRLALGIAELFGLPQAAAKVEDKLEADFWPAVDAGGLFILDNADTRTRWLADAVANAATAGCVSRRRLYTDADTLQLRPRAWLAITTANPTFASDSGLADRLLVVRLKRRQGTTSDAALSDEITANRDAALSYIAEALSGALADQDPTPEGLNQRHPDFAAFAVRIGRALGREAEAVAALSSAEADKSLFCLQNSTVGAAVLACVASGDALEGTAAELKDKLACVEPDLADDSAKSIGRRLSGLWPHIEAQCDAKRTQIRGGTWKFTIQQKEASAGLQL